METGTFKVCIKVFKSLTFNITMNICISRMVHHRERLAARGIDADQITQFWCVQNPEACLLSEDPAAADTTEEKCSDHGNGVERINLSMIPVLLSIYVLSSF